MAMAESIVMLLAIFFQFDILLDSMRSDGIFDGMDEMDWDYAIFVRADLRDRKKA